jgi:hypothetical protein
MSFELIFPRTIYRGPASDAAETGTAASADDFEQKKKDGWRLKRIDKKHEAEAPKPATVAVPAQTLTVASSVPTTSAPKAKK